MALQPTTLFQQAPDFAFICPGRTNTDSLTGQTQEFTPAAALSFLATFIATQVDKRGHFESSSRQQVLDDLLKVWLQHEGWVGNSGSGSVPVKGPSVMALCQRRGECGDRKWNSHQTPR